MAEVGSACWGNDGRTEVKDLGSLKFYSPLPHSGDTPNSEET